MAKATLALVEGDSDRTREPLARWQQTFLRALRQLPSVRDACRAARVSRQTAYRHRKANPEFAELWADAIAHAVDDLESVAFALAKAGDSSLISFLLRCHRPEVYKDTQRHEVGLVGGIVFLPQKAEGSE